MKHCFKIALLVLLLVGGPVACTRRSEATVAATRSAEPSKKLTPQERLIGHWITETVRPDGTKCFANDYFFRQDGYTTTFRVTPEGRIFRFDWSYRVLSSDGDTIVIETLAVNTQSEYTFLGETLTHRAYTEKKRAWREEALMHRVDDRTSP